MLRYFTLEIFVLTLLTFGLFGLAFVSGNNQTLLYYACFTFVILLWILNMLGLFAAQKVTDTCPA